MAHVPYEGPCKRCGGTEDVTAGGRFRGLCATCRPLVAAEQTARREADPIAHDLRQGKRPPPLKQVCLELAASGEKLEQALQDRNLARDRAQSALHEFKEGLALVGRVAQSLVNPHKSALASEQQ